MAHFYRGNYSADIRNAWNQWGDQWFWNCAFNSLVLGTCKSWYLGMAEIATGIQMTAREEKDRSRDVVPSRLPDVTPPLAAPDYGLHLMQSILEIQRSLGGLEHAVVSLEVRSKEQGDKLDHLVKDVYAAKIVVSVVGALLLLAASFLGWVITTYISAHSH